MIELSFPATAPRVAAPCPHFGPCGGCLVQDRAYADQLAAKDAAVRALLDGLSIEEWRPIRPSPEIFFYRNKMEFSFGDARDRLLFEAPKGTRPVFPVDPLPVHLGLHPRNRFAIVLPTPDCRLLSEASQGIVGRINAWANDHRISVYTRKDGAGDLRHVVIREGKNTGERMVNLVAKAATPAVADLAERLKSADVTTFLWSAYDGRSDVAGADKRTVYWGDGSISDRIGRITVRVTPSSFFQTNTRAAEGMIDVLSGWAKETGQSGGALLDLYCGAGAIGLNLAPFFDEVVGVEIHGEAVKDAEANAARNGVANARFIEARSEAAVASISAARCVVVDPPRPGLHADVVTFLRERGAPSVFYVSCNPETLARDLRALGGTYRIREVQPMDFFPHTAHVETAVRLDRAG